ncbi:hypothetical protein FNF27_01809 [Cafeteria roenbergensis]|uniref:AAA+ ATPase domain-containing protein n=1 Tax=Cafeteria roenbergensis TaxID=33653 RepID=A0A5A8DUF2_CAFRO|nr:hypothetical protein FNF28_02654 [Cafeteria roenbergensis]KAA0169053.1 hypothetical protein FNF31_00213 [Cafeteria roenbergensis]KAA0176528.1 hypothetical protein FNF27_01809 [Cafeteria roenbergensis]
MASSSAAAAASAAGAVASAPVEDERPEVSPDTLPWVEKYRPATMDDLIAHKDILGTINRLIDNGKLPHLLFYGPPGTGKTSTILACAKRLYGEKGWKSMTLVLNASDDRGIGVVRDQIKGFAGTKKLFSTGVKLVILDEADAMTSDAQFALRRVIEKYTKNTRFCLICNYVSRIIPALQSRCTRFRFPPLKRSEMEARLREIIDLERVNATETGVQAILRLAQGDMRRVLNVLQATSLGFDTVDEASVYACTGDPSPKDIRLITQALLTSSVAETFELIRDMQASRGLALGDIMQGVARVMERAVQPAKAKAALFSALSRIEVRLASGTPDKHQVGALIAAFVQMRELLEDDGDDEDDGGEVLVAEEGGPTSSSSAQSS